VGILDISGCRVTLHLWREPCIDKIGRQDQRITLA
jgi:hypothetical protein